METNYWILVGGVGVFVLAIAIYVVFMVFLPEWVGITGKVALEAERSHRDEPQTDKE